MNKPSSIPQEGDLIGQGGWIQGITTEQKYISRGLYGSFAGRSFAFYLRILTMNAGEKFSLAPRERKHLEVCQSILFFVTSPSLGKKCFPWALSARFFFLKKKKKPN